MRRFKDVLFNIFLIALLVYAIAVAYFAVYPFTIIELKSLKVLQPTVVAGTYYPYQICYHKFINAPGTVNKRLLNTTTIAYSQKPTTAPIGERCEILYEYMPDYVEPDVDYKLCWSAVYHPTMLSTKQYQITSGTFTVVRKK